jgi:Ca-activated chloride channel family protein
VGLVVDSSGSMLDARDRVAAAAAAFVETSNPQDDVFALAFNEHVRSALPPEAPFTSDAAMMRGALIRALSTWGRTALYDAILAGLEYVEQGRHQRKALVLVSDGGDNASTATCGDVLRRMQMSNTVIYTVAFVDPGQRDVNPGRLRRIAAMTGGEAFQPRRMGDVAGVMSHIARDIRQAYTIGYIPANGTPRDGRIRPVRVLVKAPGYRGLSVRTRQGYVLGQPLAERSGEAEGK